MFQPKPISSDTIVVSDDHVFADTTARDAHFVTYPEELVDNLPVYITATSSLYQYKVATTSWLDITPVVSIQGDKGDTGAVGADGEGVPTGGTTGQILAKNSNTNYDTEWVDAPSGGSGVWGEITGTLSNQTDLNNALNGKIATSLIGVANGVAELNESGIVISTQLPSYVDDVVEYTNFSSFPTTGESGKIYFDLAEDDSYRWGGSAYIPIISGGVTLGETSDTAYRGDRGKTAYDHSQVAHAPSNAQKNSDITKAEIEAKLTGEISTHSHASSGVTTFIGLTDTPNSYTDQGGKVVKVNAGGTALEFAAESGGGTWGSITGTLSNQTDLNNALAGKQTLDADLTAIAALVGTSGLLRKSAANTWELDTNTYITSLSTAPNSTNWDSFARPSAVGNALKVLRLNSSATAFEFATVGTGAWGTISGTLSAQTDLQTVLDTKLESSDLNDVGYSSFATTDTLPASPSMGEIYEFIGTGTNWTLTANTGQYIRLLSVVSSAGGTIASTSEYDCVCLIYIGSNVWLVKSYVGIPEIT